MSQMTVTLLSTGRQLYVYIVTYLIYFYCTQQLYSFVSGYIPPPISNCQNVDLFFHHNSSFISARSLRPPSERHGLDYARTDQKDRPRSRR